MCTKKLLSRSVLLLSLLGVAGYVTGCAKDVGIIDRTYPNKVKKSIFMNDEQWYFMQTIVGTDFSASGGVFEGYQAGVRRIRWTVTEDTLFAYDVQAPAIGAGRKLTDPKTRRYGVVASYPIRSHFDIQRGYNTSTGQLTNVIGENSSDRPWQEREYMRVDWSRNQVDAEGLGSAVGSMAATSRTVPEDGPATDYNRTRITDDRIDVVNEYYFEPDIYSCFAMFGIDGLSQCSAGPVSIRNFFMKVGDRAKKYDPLLYPDVKFLEDDAGKRIYTYYDGRNGKKVCDDAAVAGLDNPGEDCTPESFDYFKRFGYFRTEGTIYTTVAGAHVQQHRRYYANRWNIWQNNYAEGCDASKEGCEPLPLSERNPKQIVYYLNPGFPEEKNIMSGVAALQEQWNQVFSKTVYLTHREEIDDLVKNVPDAEKQKAKAKLVRDMIAKYNDGDDHMYRIKPNSCSVTGLTQWKKMHVSEINAEAAELLNHVDRDSLAKMQLKPLLEFCAKLEFLTRSEENEANRFDWQRTGDLRYSFVNWVETSVPWLGYGPVGTDPMTGEILTGTANFAGEVAQSMGARAANIILFQAGRYNELEVAYGTYIYNETDKEEIKQIMAEQRELLASSPELLDENAPDSSEAYKADLPLLIAKNSKEAVTTVDPAELAKFEEQVSPAKMKQFMAQVNQQKLLKESQIMEKMGQPDVLAILLKDENFALFYNSLSDQFKDKDGNLTAEGKKRVLENMFGANHLIERREKLHDFNARNNIISRAMIEDEMFNVTESYKAAVPYFKNMSRKQIADEFVRRVFYSTQLHEIGHTVGLRHNFKGSADQINYHPGYWEQYLDVEKGKKSKEELNYDQNLPSWSIANRDPDAFVDDNWAPLVDPEYFGQAEFREAAIMDYTPGLISGSAGLGRYENAAVQFAYAGQIEAFAGDNQFDFASKFKNEWNNDGPSSIGTLFKSDNADGIEYFAKKGRKWVKVEDVLKQKTKEALGDSTVSPDVLVPYHFCSDEYVGSQALCAIFDYGANFSEVLNYNYENWKNINIQARYVGAYYFRYSQKFQSYQMRVLSLVRAAQVPFDFYSYFRYLSFFKRYLPNTYSDIENAALNGLNIITSVIAQPEPGEFCLDSSQGRFIPARGGCSGDSIKISMKEGADYGSALAEDYRTQFRRIGAYYGKQIAIQSFFLISNNVAAQILSTDPKSADRSYWNGFRSQVNEYVKSMVLGGDAAYGVVNDENKYEPPKVVWAQQLVDPNSPSPQIGMPRLEARGPGEFSFQIYSILFNLLINNTPFDDQPNAIQYMKVCASNKECFNECAPVQDPLTGKFSYVPQTNNVKECKVFEHPATSQVYIAPIGNNGESIAGDIIDLLNISKMRVEQLAAELKKHPNDQDLIKDYDYANSDMEYWISILDLIRRFMMNGLY